MKKAIFLVAAVLLLSACAGRSHLRGCELSHPYHQAQTPQRMVVPHGLQTPRTRATFHVPEQQYLADQPTDWATAADVENLEPEQLKQKRCIVAPPRIAE